MQIVLKFVKHGRDNKEVIRQKVINLNTAGFFCNEAEAAAAFFFFMCKKVNELL